MTLFRRILAAALVAAAILPAVASADLSEISADQVKAWVDAHRAGKAKGVLVDARPAEEYAAGHIPGAISIPADRVKEEAARLPKDKATPLIFYCRGFG